MKKRCNIHEKDRISTENERKERKEIAKRKREKEGEKKKEGEKNKEGNGWSDGGHEGRINMLSTARSKEKK